jgi:superfamily II DNA helicase RecQ
MELRPSVLSALAEKLGYPRLQDWQVELTKSILEGKDVVLTAGTGQGKTTLLYAPLLVTRLQNPTAIGLSVIPTKALGLDQVCFLSLQLPFHSPEIILKERSASSRGIPAVAINEDTVRRASSQGRNLFKEVLEGQFGLVVVSPEMLTSHPFNRVLEDHWFQSQLCLAFIDECDLVEEQGSGFRPCYKSIGDLRARLPTSTPWVAVSATLPGGKTFDRVMELLGFQHGQYIRTSLPIDNPNICYVPRFYSYPTSDSTFLDLAWLIPSTITFTTNITKTLIFCESIAFGTRVYKFLQHLLPRSLSTTEVILVYHSLISDKGRSRAMERFRLGTTRIIVATDCFTWGVDVPDIRNVVLFGLPSSFSKLIQQIGRAGRDKNQAYAITYAPLWVQDIPDDAVKGTKREATDLDRRNNMCPILRQWFNPTPTHCPRDVLCLHFGETPSHPSNCCTQHHRALPHMEPEKSQVTAFTPQRAKGSGVRSDGTYPPFNKKDDNTLRLSISRMISTWTRRTWAQRCDHNSLLPPTSFLSQALQDHLCEKFHVVTSLKNLSTVLADWPHLKEYGAELFSFCKEALEELDNLRKEAEEEESRCEVEETKPAKILIRPPQVRAEDDSSVEERPRKRHCGESGIVM